ncbi:hypothetical protein DBY21_04250 [Candidatus Gastranaerophilales bacterium]|nr:MAG: hypothetical protein DBY21_04250 [Candidatus Gastranaerophilales bacterium]
MSVKAVQNYENRNQLSNVLTSTVVGGLVGFSAKYSIPLSKRETQNVDYRAILNIGYKNANVKKANAFKLQKTRTAAQDEFIKMIDDKEPFKNPSLQMIAERLGGKTKPIGQKIYAVIENDANKNLDLEGLTKILGDESEDVKAFSKAFEDKPAFTNLSLDEITAKLGGADAPLAKKVAKIFRASENKNLSFETVARSLGNESKDVLEVTRVSRLKNAFAKDNLDYLVRKLGGESSQAGQEFRRIIKEVNMNAKNLSKSLKKAFYRNEISGRYTAPFVIAGAAAGFAGAIIHNMIKHNTEA